MKEWWEGKFDKKPDPDYILSGLIDIYERQNGVKVIVEKESPQPCWRTGEGGKEEE